MYGDYGFQDLDAPLLKEAFDCLAHEFGQGQACFLRVLLQLHNLVDRKPEGLGDLPFSQDC